MAVWTCMREYGGEVAFSVGQPCPWKMTILRLCHCIGVVWISSFVSVACVVASAPSAEPTC